jgi:hypothetical protein
MAPFIAGNGVIFMLNQVTPEAQRHSLRTAF